MSRTKQVLERHVAAFNAQDFDADPWTTDAEMVVPGAELHGREQIFSFNRMFWEGFPDARLEVVRSIVEEPFASSEGLFVGTHSGVLRTPGNEVSPTGRRVELRWIAMYEVREDELVSEHLYFDQVDFLTQLGVMPAAPAEASQRT